MQYRKKTSRAYYEFYRVWVSRIGVHHLKALVPGKREFLTARFETCPTLGNVPLVGWEDPHGIVRLLIRQAGINPDGWSVTETVSLLKHVAIYEIVGALPDFEDEDSQAS